uniref:Uncharacterized protein n=1 Tax=Oryza glumipatula TaxID=40148 RepID=A0A0E0BSF6_9ORYZ
MADEGSSRAELVEPLPLPLPAPDLPSLGRPLGSKNKPKPPVVAMWESKAVMSPVVLELVGYKVAAFAWYRRVGVTVAATTLLLPASPATAVKLHGQFEVPSLSRTVQPSTAEGEPRHRRSQCV